MKLKKLKKTNFRLLKDEERRLITKLSSIETNDPEYDSTLHKLTEVRSMIVRSIDSSSKKREILNVVIPAGVSFATFMLALFVEFSGESMFTSTAAKTTFRNLTK